MELEDPAGVRGELATEKPLQVLAIRVPIRHNRLHVESRVAADDLQIQRPPLGYWPGGGPGGRPTGQPEDPSREPYPGGGQPGG